MPDILVIDAHPNGDSLCAALAARYAHGAHASGADVDMMVLRELAFDPILHAGLRAKQPLEPDLAAAQRRLEAAGHVCLITPLWWGSVPALLKGFCDRVLERGWAYRYDERGMPHGLLKGRSARVLLTTDSPGWYLWLLQGNPAQRQLVRSTLRFCGYKPVRLDRFGPVHASTPARRMRWLERAQQRGAEDARANGHPEPRRLHTNERAATPAP